MGSLDKKYRVNFSGDGAALLRDRISEKLKEFMGDYTDDVLVEYVTVLLRNGRDKEEAKNELNVFLGDDSDSFVSWLWDHLATNLDLYVQPQETHTEEVARTNPTLVEQTGRNESHHMDSEPLKVKPDNSYRGRHKREWKDVMRDVSHQPPLRSSVVVNIHQEKKTLCNVSRARRSPSPQSPQLKKRSQHEEQHVKRDTVSQASSGAPRRLLQFAVRDAFRTLRPPGMVKEPSLKRLRSVVSTSTEDTSLVDRPRRLRSIARVPNPMATVLKAVQEAADVVKVKSSRSVFDRLGRDMDASLTTEQVTEFRDAAAEDDKYEELNAIQVHNHSKYPQRSKYCGHAGPMNMTEHEAGLTSDLMSDDDTNVVDHRVMDVSQTGTSYGSKGEDSLMSKYSGAKDQDKSVSAANTSLKIVNISVNVNAWRPPHYQEPRDAVMDNQKSVQNNEKNAGKFGAKLMKEVSKPVSVGNGNRDDEQAKHAGYIHQEPQKPSSSASGSYTAGHPLEDADSRTIFVSNVHFAATKDSLSRHFIKFGEVLKVVIVTDAATGQPTGSAYVEFMRKEAADNGLSLDGTSFMSRILKVMKKSSSSQEANPITSWPRIAHCSPYAAGRFSRGAFPRGFPAAFRPQLHVKPGARSLQWKRDAHATPAESRAAVSGSSVVSPSARSLTYVRTEPKPVRNLGNA